MINIIQSNISRYLAISSVEKFDSLTHKLIGEKIIKEFSNTNNRSMRIDVQNIHIKLVRILQTDDVLDIKKILS